MSEKIFTREDLRAALAEAAEHAKVAIIETAAKFQKEIDRLETENAELRRAREKK